VGFVALIGKKISYSALMRRVQPHAQKVLLRGDIGCDRWETRRKLILVKFARRKSTIHGALLQTWPDKPDNTRIKLSFKN